MSEQEYITTDLGLAAFPLFILSEDFFIGSEKREGQRHSKFVFSDTCPGNSCGELASLYHSGAQLTNAKEFAECHKSTVGAMRVRQGNDWNAVQGILRRRQ